MRSMYMSRKMRLKVAELHSTSNELVMMSMGAIYNPTTEPEGDAEVSLALPEVEIPLNDAVTFEEYGVGPSQRQGLWTRARKTVENCFSTCSSAFPERIRALFSWKSLWPKLTMMAIAIVFLVVLASTIYVGKTKTKGQETPTDMMIVVPKESDNQEKRPVVYDAVDSEQYKEMVKNLWYFLNGDNYTATSGHGNNN